MRGISLGTVASVCDGRYFGNSPVKDKEISFITTDSRKAGEGCLFAAMRGERNDGHDFIGDAFAKGAVCCISERPVPGLSEPLILVESTAEALKKLAAYYRAQFDIPVIGVTGSVGKTTTKDMISSVLSERFTTLKNMGNFNNELGVPLTLFELRDEHELAVLEMGVSDFGEMSRLTAMARPDIAVFTVIGDAHLEFFKSRRGVLRAKAEITEGMPENGLVMLNGDDDLQSAYDFGKATLSYGLGEHCELRAENVSERGLDGTVCDIVGEGRHFTVAIPVYGKHMIYAALAAAAAGIRLGLSDSEIISGIAKYTPEEGRANVIRLKHCTIIDDCYNANPTSVLAALRSIAELEGRRVCILGDMLELGAASEQLHTETGSAAAKTGIDLIIACGPKAEAIYRGALWAGANALYYQSKDKLLAELPSLITKDDTILIKASRSMRFEDIVRAAADLELKEG